MHQSFGAAMFVEMPSAALVEYVAPIIPGPVPFQKVVSLLDELKKNKLNSITFDTRPED